MIRFKECVPICVVLSLQLQLVYSQWYRSSNSEPVFYVPSSAPPEYARAVQGYSPKDNVQPVGVPTGPPFLSGVPYGVPPPIGCHQGHPVPSGVPFAGVPPPLGIPPLYEGQHQAAAASAAHPNQPVIIINNGDYGGKKDSSGLFGDDGGLLALLLASHAHHGHGHHEYGPPEPLPPPPIDNGGRAGNNGPLNINITIIMPKSDDTKTKNEEE